MNASWKTSLQKPSNFQIHLSGLNLKAVTTHLKITRTHFQRVKFKKRGV